MRFCFGSLWRQPLRTLCCTIGVQERVGGLPTLFISTVEF
jgi:hypothetical protein